MLIVTLIEIKTSRSIIKDYYKIDGHDPILNDDSEDVDAAQRKMREEALKGIMAAMEEGDHGVFTEHHEEDET